MRTFTILFILGFFVSCASNLDKPIKKEEPRYPYIDYPGTHR